LITVIELKKLKGRSKFDFPVQSIISLWVTGIIKTSTNRSCLTFKYFSFNALAIYW
jgi:hypothetical protein